MQIGYPVAATGYFLGEIPGKVRKFNIKDRWFNFSLKTEMLYFLM